MKLISIKCVTRLVDVKLLQCQGQKLPPSGCQEQTVAGTDNRSGGGNPPIPPLIRALTGTFLFPKNTMRLNRNQLQP